MDEAKAVCHLGKVARLQDRGFICAAAMWGEVVRALDGLDPGQILGRASPECQAALRRVYRDGPVSLRGEGRDEASRRLVEAVEGWCLAADEPGAQADPRPPVGDRAS